MCTLSFADGSHCIFYLYTKSIFFGKTFLYTQKAKQQILFTYGIFKSQILRALMSNKNVMLHL